MHFHANDPKAAKAFYKLLSNTCPKTKEDNVCVFILDLCCQTVTIKARVTGHIWSSDGLDYATFEILEMEFS